MSISPEQLTPEQYAALIADAEVLHRDRRGVQVLLTPDGRIVKLFYRRRGFSSDLIRPYALRFASNAIELKERGIPSVEIERLCRCRDPRLDLVVYPMLAGEPVRELATTTGEYRRALHALPGFVAELHRLGICFKGLHPGNILYQSPDRFSLIDIVNVDFSRSPLAIGKRAGNLHHLLCRKEDYTALCDYGMEVPIGDYLSASGLKPAEQYRLLQQLLRRAKNQPGLAAACRQLLEG
ncbi:MAG: toluene tolerance protein [Pseudomonadota bacterium]|nr:toluene tolerance protein [Pseudomonadota bacterium]